MISKSTWTLVVLFLILLAGAYLWNRKQAETELQPTPAAEVEQLGNLFDLQSQPVTVRIERVGDRMIELRADEQGQWQIIAPAGLTADSELVASTLGQLAAVPLVSRLEGAPALADMGLAPQAVYRLLVITQDGKQWVANIGNPTPTQSGYYALASARQVVVVSKYALDPILGFIDNPPVLLMPEATPSGSQVPELLPLTPVP